MSTADDLISFSFFLNSQLAKQTDFFKNIYLSPPNAQNLEGYTVNFKHNLNFNHIIAY